jgi:hypothetical protein
MQSFNDEFWVNPQIPTLVMPFETTQRLHASVPIVTFGHLTHTVSGNTLWDMRVGRFVYSRKDDLSTGDLTTPNRFDRVTGVSSGGLPQFGGLTLIPTTVKATLSHYRPGLFAADHQWKVGTQIERAKTPGPPSFRAASGSSTTTGNRFRRSPPLPPSAAANSSRLPHLRAMP